MAHKSEFWILSNYKNYYKYLLLTMLKTNTYDLFITGTTMSNPDDTLIYCQIVLSVLSLITVHKYEKLN